MDRARRHQRLLARLALVLLALVAELAGRSLTHRLDIGRHVARPSYAGADYYPVLLAVVKVGVALMLARLMWRFVKARSVARAARRLLVAQESAARLRGPRVRLELSPRLWLGSFVATSFIYLLQMHAEGISTGHGPMLAPWLHTSALPVFAVLSVLVALLYRTVELWLSAYESYALESAARASRLSAESPMPRVPLADLITPRSLFGLAFEVRPPPLPA
jgi:hypothetical protein